MKQIDSLLNEYKAIKELLEDAELESTREAVANANRRLDTITRNLWNLGINPKQIERLTA